MIGKAVQAAFFTSTIPTASLRSVPRTAILAGKQVSNAGLGLSAGVVLFRPDPDAWRRLIRVLKAEVERVYVVLNSPIPSRLRVALESDPAIRLLGSERNLGIGAALNMILSAGQSDGCERLILFDQDSRPAPGLIATIDRAALELDAAGQAPAVVAPRLIAARDQPPSRAPTYQSWRRAHAVAGHRPVAFTPTSGSLLMLRHVTSIGAFRADYFIDGIDLEWCFRAWSAGHGCWLVADARMEHTIGRGLIRGPLPKFAMPKQEPFRMHCYVRNSLYGLRLPHVPKLWKAKQFAYLPVQILAYAVHHRFDAAVMRELAAGIFDGLRGQLGVPTSAPGR